MAILETFKGTETEVGFSAVQIILLIELGEAQDAYTYPLPEEEDIIDEDYILAAQDLTVRGFLEYAEEKDGAGLRLTEKARELLDGMLNPVRILEAFSLREGVIPVLAYRGKGSLYTVTKWDISGGYVGIIRLDGSAIGEWLTAEGFLPDQPFETVRDAENALKYDPQMEKRGSQVKEGLVCSSQAPPAVWALQENVRSALRSVEVSEEGEEKTCVYVFLETDTESWILTDAESRILTDAESRILTDTGSRILTDTRQGGAGKRSNDPTEAMKRNNEPDWEDGRNWTLEPDSVEYRKEIWRKLL